MRSLCLMFIFAFANSINIDENAEDLNSIFYNKPDLKKWMMDKLLQGHYNFTLDLNRALINNTHENIVFSPTSLFGTLAMILLGANGETFIELARVLHYDKDLAINKYSEILHAGLGSLFHQLSHPSFNLTYANGLFLQQSYLLRTNYLNAANYFYHPQLIHLDFSGQPEKSKNYINNWMRKKTNGKINNLLDNDLPLETQLVLGSALYFKANWEFQFNVADTRKEIFFIEANKTVEIDMMVQTGNILYNHDKDLNASLIVLPYDKKEVSMYVLLPDETGKTALNDLIQKLTVQKLSSLVNGVSESLLQVALPKMNLSTGVPIKTALENLGLEVLFNDRADLSLLVDARNPGKSDQDITYSQMEEIYKNYLDVTTRMLKRKGIDRLRNLNCPYNSGVYIQSIHHKVKMEINELGTEGAGATAFNLASRTVPDTFFINRPFLFFIQRKDPALILFWAAIYKL